MWHRRHLQARPQNQKSGVPNFITNNASCILILSELQPDINSTIHQQESNRNNIVLGIEKKYAIFHVVL